MMKKRSILLTFLIVYLFVLAIGGKKVYAQIPSRPDSYYYDETNILDDKTKELVEKTSENYQKTKKKPQVVVAAIKSTDGDSIDSYAPDLFENWGIGNSKYNNGVLILYALNNGQRNVRIEVGYGLEGAITDAQTGQILQKYKNDLKSNDTQKINYGLQHVFNSVTTLIDKEYGYKVTKEKNKEESGNDNNPWGSLVIFVIIILIALFFNGGGSSGPGGRYYRRGTYVGTGMGGYFGSGSGGSSGGGFGGFGGGSSGGGGSSI
ncbi:TPM domain-containing protein [Companilactobacillus sp. DQM5]|uniref:TPM domain-containing protein n=1 Tax=Companilactobacillus sp. DQM5 TaxID=3463359 RepID=UPI004059AA53